MASQTTQDAPAIAKPNSLDSRPPLGLPSDGSGSAPATAPKIYVTPRVLQQRRPLSMATTTVLRMQKMSAIIPTITCSIRRSDFALNTEG